ncbi:MAG: TlpA family protein disulfide reductase [Bdellovibrionales bacterium]|nr:TlpA family protein disulfide reductase [Bdellovibrionales bacterium]
MQSNEKSPFLRAVKLLLAALLLGGVWWGWYSWEERAERPVEAVKVGKRAMEFSATSQEMLQGDALALATSPPVPTLLHFWGTWCGPCVAELPELLELARSWKGIRVVAVAMDDRAAVDKFIQRHPKLADMGNHMKVVLDPQGRIADLYQVTRFPETFLINRQFLVDNRFVGPQPWLSKAMRPYLGRIQEDPK